MQQSIATDTRERNRATVRRLIDKVTFVRLDAEGRIARSSVL